MENTQVVSSYVRGVRSHKQEANHDHTMSILIGGASVIMLAIVFAQVTIVVGLSVGAVYGLKTVLATNPRQTVVEAVTQAPEASEKPKRHYSKRLTVNMYDTGKTIRV